MSQTESLEQKIDELLRAIGGLERLRELARLSSLDHLVNLHLLSHLTKLDKIEGLDRLQQLDKLEELKKLDNLQVFQKLDKLNKLDDLSKLDSLVLLERLEELKNIEGLRNLEQLSKLDQLDKLNELRRLDALGSLRDLGGLERLDHLKYLENLDRLKELTALTQLESLSELKQTLENNEDKFALLRHLEALDNLPLLSQLSQLEQLAKLDQLKELDKLSELRHLDRLTDLSDMPPMVPPVPAQPGAPPSPPVVTEVRKSVQSYAIDFVLDLVRTLVLAAGLVAFLLLPQGRRVAGQAAAFLGFGHGTQVSWALETLSRVSPDEFARYWADFEMRLSQEAELVFNSRAPWTLEKRYETLFGLWSYQFEHQGISLHERVKSDLSLRLSKAETKWMERINTEIAQVMQRSNEGQKLALWNQLKDLAVGGRWSDLLKTSRSITDDRFAQEAAILAMVHLLLAEDPELQTIMDK